jgi:hypothetical protein
MGLFRRRGRRIRRNIRNRRGVSGRTVEQPLQDLLQILEYGAHTGVLTLRESDESVVGEIHLREGRIVRLRYRTLHGRRALAAMLDNRVLYFDFKPSPLPEEAEEEAPSTISLLLDAIHLMEERRRRRTFLVQNTAVLYELSKFRKQMSRLSDGARRVVQGVMRGTPLRAIMPEEYSDAEAKVLEELTAAVAEMLESGAWEQRSPLAADPAPI